MWQIWKLEKRNVFANKDWMTQWLAQIEAEIIKKQAMNLGMTERFSSDGFLKRKHNICKDTHSFLQSKHDMQGHTQYDRWEHYRQLWADRMEAKAGSVLIKWLLV